jgi:hypothetical protein
MTRFAGEIYPPKADRSGTGGKDLVWVELGGKEKVKN